MNCTGSNQWVLRGAKPGTRSGFVLCPWCKRELRPTAKLKYPKHTKPKGDHAHATKSGTK